MISLFAITFLVSFVASAQPGVTNLTVIRATLHQSRKSGFWTSLGGCLPELLYAGAVAYGSQWFLQSPDVQRILRIVAVPALLLLGILALIRSRRAQQVAVETVKPVSTTTRKSFFQGLTVALLNPQLPLFWFFVLMYYSNYPWLQITTLAEQLVFALSAAGGAFTILNLYVLFIHRRREKLSQYLQPHRFDLIMGCGLIGLALWRAVALI
jgi:threonine/homoserine/homoserine lactone efflux protein